MPKRKTNEEFINEVYNLVGDEYIILEKYKNNSTEIEMKHNNIKCNHVFKITPRNFINKGRRCPKCFKDSIICKENFKSKVHQRFKDEYIVLEEYQGVDVRIKFKHNIDACGKVFYKSPEKFWYRNQLCPCIEKNKRKLLATENFKEKLYDEVGDEYVLLCTLG